MAFADPSQGTRDLGTCLSTCVARIELKSRSVSFCAFVMAAFGCSPKAYTDMCTPANAIGIVCDTRRPVHSTQLSHTYQYTCVHMSIHWCGLVFIHVYIHAHMFVRRFVHMCAPTPIHIIPHNIHEHVLHTCMYIYSSTYLRRLRKRQRLDVPVESPKDTPTI